ncbi:MAG: hypothetical protein KF718_14700 [Polyangiaceae bacterium]|nr:hypothetical protein [Polyangiaceae bacterium]
MTELVAILGLAIACALWVLLDRAAGGCGGGGRCGACGGGSCSRRGETD